MLPPCKEVAASEVRTHAPNRQAGRRSVREEGREPLDHLAREIRTIIVPLELPSGITVTEPTGHPKHCCLHITAKVLLSCSSLRPETTAMEMPDVLHEVFEFHTDCFTHLLLVPCVSYPMHALSLPVGGTEREELHGLSEATSGLGVATSIFIP